MIRFVAYGLPRPQGSKNQFGGEASKYVKGWRATIAACAAGAHAGALIRGPVKVTYRFYYPRPADHFGRRKGEPYLKPGAPGYPMGREGDLDKLQRAVNDAISGVIWKDDKQVVMIGEGSGRFYGEPARVEVEVTEI